MIDMTGENRAYVIIILIGILLILYLLGTWQTD